MIPNIIACPSTLLVLSHFALMLQVMMHSEQLQYWTEYTAHVYLHSLISCPYPLPPDSSIKKIQLHWNQEKMDSLWKSLLLHCIKSINLMDSLLQSCPICNIPFLQFFRHIVMFLRVQGKFCHQGNRGWKYGWVTLLEPRILHYIVKRTAQIRLTNKHLPYKATDKHNEVSCNVHKLKIQTGKIER